MKNAEAFSTAPVKPDRGPAIEIHHLYISPGHNYFGHHGKPPGENTILEVPSVECLAGRGLRGDRFLDYKDNYKGQITFFALEIYHEISHALNVWDKPASVFRRNVVTEGVDLNEMIGLEFEIQGVRFRGIEDCKPCYWMDQAFAQGAERFLQNRGGLRAHILTDGLLKVNA